MTDMECLGKERDSFGTIPAVPARSAILGTFLCFVLFRCSIGPEEDPRYLFEVCTGLPSEVHRALMPDPGFQGPVAWLCGFSVDFLNQRPARGAEWFDGGSQRLAGSLRCWLSSIEEIEESPPIEALVTANDPDKETATCSIHMGK